MVNLNQYVTIYTIFQLILVSVQRTAQTSFKLFLLTRKIVDGANSAVITVADIFKSRPLKMVPLSILYPAVYAISKV